MVWPVIEDNPDWLTPRVGSCAATSATWIPGDSRKLPALRCEVSNERISSISSESPPHCWRRNSSCRSAGISSAACSSSSTRFQRSASIRRFATHLAVQPGSRRGPVARYRHRRYLEHFRRLVESQASEKAHFHDLGLAGIDSRQG